MNVLDLLSSLRKANIQISLVDDKLKIKAPQGAITPEIKQQLTEAKQEIIEFLKEASAPVGGVSTIPKSPRDQALSLSYTQEALWTLDRVNPGSVAYNLPMAFKFFGELRVDLLQQAISKIIERHETLRLSVLETEDGKPVAHVSEPWEFNLPQHDFILDAEGDYSSEIKKVIDHYAMRPFDLSKGPLCRFDLIRVSGRCEQHSVLVVCLHHVISDGLSQNLLVREIAIIYAALLQGAPVPLPPLDIQYLDFAAWQRETLAGDKLDKEISFWKNQLEGVPPLLALPTDRPRPFIQSTKGAKYHFDIPSDTAQATISFCQSNGYTVFMGLMAALQMVLSRHAQQTDFCIGMPTAGRHYRELEQLIGFFVNGVLVRANLQGNPSWQTHLDNVKQRMLDVLSHQETPAQLIIDHLDISRNPSYPPLAQVGFQLQNFSGSVQGGDEDVVMMDTFRKMTNLSMEPIRLEEAESKFDMIVSVAQNDADLSGYVEYNTDLFDESTVARLVTHFTVALDSMVSETAERIQSIALESVNALGAELDLQQGEVVSRLTTTQLAFVQDIELRPDTKQYAVGFNYEIHKNVSASVLELAINHVVSQHAILRARFVRCDLPWADSAYQIFQPSKNVPLEVVDIGPRVDAREFVESHFNDWCYRTHDIFSDELIRFQLVVSGDRSWLLLSCHHIILDGISGMAMLTKIVENYEANLSGTELSIYQDYFPEYVSSHNKAVDDPDSVAFWRDRALEVSPLVFSIPPAWPHKKDYQILRHGLSDDLLNDIHAYCRKQKTHPSIVYRLIASLMIKQYCRPDSDFVLWDIQSGRAAGYEQEIGVFYQQVPYVISSNLLSAGHTAGDFYTQQRKYRREIKDHTLLSLSTLNALFPTGSINFQYNYFNFLQPVSMDGSSSLPDTFSSHVDGTVQIFVKDYGDSVDFELWFDGSVFTPLHFLPRMEQVTRHLIASPQMDLSNVQYELPQETATREAWNEQPRVLPYDGIIDWFAESVRKHPVHSALIFGDLVLSYEQLDSISNRLANHLSQQGVEQYDRVGVFLGRSQWSLISILAVIKLGAVYVPIEAAYPKDRVQYILTDSGARTLITESCLQIKAEEFDGNVVTVDCLDAVLASVQDDPQSVTITKHDPIYAIYTSGSTGKPKGALVTHGGEVNLQTWYTEQSEFKVGDKSLIISAFGFDLTQKNLFGPLLCGGAVVIPAMEQFDADVVALEIEKHGITHINCAPSALYSIVEGCDLNRAAQLKSLRWVFLGGEPIRLGALQQWLQSSDTSAQIVNSYGPTECTDVVSFHVIRNIASENTLIPIGKPICNTQIHIVDDNLLPVAMGAVGEIVIAGAGVGLGYIGRDDLSSEVFVNSDLAEGKLYRTGDLGRFCPDGSIEYIGRKDFQVKVRGLRIELGEVESAVKSIDGIIDSVVLVHNDALIAYGLNPLGVKPENWQAELRAKIPDYMVPAHLEILEKWPLTPNGKIDRKALPAPNASERSVPFVEPRNETEKLIAQIWVQVLKVDQVGVDDSFFDLGGHSLLANQIVSRIRKHFEVELPLRDLILHPTVALLSQRVAMAQKRVSLGELVAVSRDQRIPLSASQKRVWLLDRIEPGNVAYHVPSIVTIKGNLNAEILDQAFAYVVNRHEGLRAYFKEDEEGPFQHFLPCGDWALTKIDAQDDTEDRVKQRVAAQVVLPFDIENGPLFRSALIQRSQNEYILLVVLHHIVTDGWSNGLLVRELGEAYVQIASSGQLNDQPLPLQYADFAAWQHNMLVDQLSEKVAFWCDMLVDVPALELPTDYPRPSVQTFNGASIDFKLSVAASTALNELANRFQATNFMVLLAAYGALLQRYSGQEELAIGTPVAGRDMPELESIVGFFVNTVAIRVSPDSTQSFVTLLEQVKDRALRCFEHQDVPFEQIVEELNPPRDMSRSPIFQVMLAYQNLPQSEGGLAAAQVGDISLEPFQLDIDTAKFEQTLTLWPENNRLGGSFTYNTDLFSSESAHQFVNHFIEFCENAFSNPNSPLFSIGVLGQREINQQVIEWNQTSTNHNIEQRVEALFDQCAARCTNDIAVVQGSSSLTFAELSNSADSIAKQMADSGVGRGDFVGVVLDRNLHLMSAILGVLRLGAVYVPIDGNYPEERIRYICDQSEIKIILSLAHLVRNIPNDVNVLDIGNIQTWRQECSGAPSFKPIDYSHEDLLYVIYTSGSTGNPKGTGAYHRSEVNLLNWYTEQFGMNSSDRVLLLSSIGFDLTQKNLFAPLVSGARLIIPDFQEFDPSKIISTIAAQEVTWLNCAPSAFYPLVDNESDWANLSSLRYVFLGGEPINMSRLEPWLRQSQCQLVNSYGPTECADIAAWHQIDLTVDGNKRAIPIGRPNYNVELYVLGEHQELLPRGAVGELCIGGAGVGPGYLNQPDLTRQVFVGNPYKPGSVLYRTGDRVRYEEDGKVVYLGRRDHQIKLRGYRIEAGEIQSLINRTSSVKESLVDVVKTPSGIDQLVAWVAFNEGAGDKDQILNSLRSACADNLPVFMQPDSWVLIDAFKLTANGKIDRKALPAPDWLERKVEFVAPRDENEVLLSEIWAQVLHLDQVGVFDNFFELGGHSLLATQVVARLRSRSGIVLPIRDLMAEPTIAALAAKISRMSADTDAVPLIRVDRNQRLSLSFAQQRLWLLDKIEPGSLAYSVPSILRINGSLKPDVLERALSKVLNRHEGLRTVFKEDDVGPYQLILPEQDWSLPLVDVASSADSLDEQAILKEAKRLIAVELMTPFDLASGPLFRCRLYQLSESEFIFLVLIHHIVTDGWSMNILVQDLGNAYIQMDLHGEVYLERLPIQYADYSTWQRLHLDEDRQEQLMGYWRQNLAGVEPLVLPTDYRRPAIQTYNGDTVRFEVPAVTRSLLHHLSIEQNASLFAGLLSGFFILLRQYSGQNDFCVGTPVAGRERSELEKVVGFFVNTLAVRADVAASDCFNDVLVRVKQSLLDGYAHQEVPFEQIVEEIDPARDMSRSPLFQVMLAYQNIPMDQQGLGGQETLGDISLEPFDPGVDSSKYEITMTLWDTEDGFGGSLQYNTDLFSQSTIESMSRHFVALLEQLSSKPDTPICALNYLSQEERDQQVIEWNLTDREYDRALTLDRALTKSLHLHAAQTAIICGGESLSYAELQASSNRVAHLLQARGVRAGDCVGLCLDRNLHLMSIIIGILKAGATYIPLDASYPAQRIQYILENAQADLVVTQQHLSDVLPPNLSTLIWEDHLESLDTLPESFDPVTVQPEQLLYLIFTSGSTGNPKGTGAYHRSAMNLLNWYCGQFNMTASDKVLLLSAVGFDLTQKNLFAPLLSGAALVIPDFTEFDGEKITTLLQKEQVTWLNCAPSAFYALQDERSDWGRLSSIRLLFLGGEPINVPRLSDWLRQSKCQLINSYGPTECADIAAWYPVHVDRDYDAPALPIGRPNYNVQLYVLGDQQELLPIGAIGELCIAGDGVGPGYINNQEQTEASFLPNPYSNEGTLYRTGDRVRYRVDGNVEYLGRRDHQVKLRGYRIEAGEIQSVINHAEVVKDSLVDVVKDENGIQRLVAWVVVPDVSGDWENKAIAACADHLPAFMIPEIWLALEAFPLTPNGKIDRKALPKPMLVSTAEYVQPETDAEASLCQLWSAILGVDRVGVTDNFFTLGGQSLLATQLVSRMGRLFERSISVRMLFDYPTIRQIVHQLEQSAHVAQRPIITRRPDIEQAPLSFGQQRLWFFEQLNPGTQANNMPVAIKIKGALDCAVLQKAFSELCRRHESLRTSFLAGSDGAPVQLIHSESEFVLEVEDITALDPSELDIRLDDLIRQNSQNPIALTAAPLMRAKVVVTSNAPNEQHLLLCMHHIISDGASQVVLFRELMTLYVAYMSDQPSPLPELMIQYPDFAHWQRQWLDDEAMASQLEYWRQQLADAPILLDLPLDKPRPKVQTTNGSTVSRALPEVLTQELKALCEQQGVTLFMATLLAWQVLLSRFSGQKDVVVGVPSLGRHAPELENIIGFFIQSLVFRSKFDNNPLIEGALQQVKQTVLDGFSNGDVPVDKIVEHLSIPRSSAYSPLVQVAFQLLDNADFNASEMVGNASIGGMEIEVVGGQTASAKFDLTLNLTLNGNQLSASLEYNTDLFQDDTAEFLLEGFERVCQQFVDNLQQPLTNISIVAEPDLLSALGLDPTECECVQPLSRMQHDMFLDSLVNPDSLQSSHGWNIHVRKPLDVDLWSAAIEDVARQQPMLRAQFIAAEKACLDMGYLAVFKQRRPVVDVIDLRQEHITDCDLSDRINKLIYKPYDIQNDDLITFHVLVLEDDHFVVVTAVHHALLDGASLNVLWLQLTNTYSQLLVGQTAKIQSIDFSEFVNHDRMVMDTAPVLNFWQQRLASVEPLGFTVPSPVPAPAHFITRELMLEQDHWSQVKLLCRKHRITPSLYFKCLFGYLIQQYCRADSDFSLQETMGGRIKGHAESMGCYIQEIPFVFEKQSLAPNQRFIDVLEYARQYQKTIKDQRLISIGKQLELSPKGRIGFMYNFYQFLATSKFLGDSYSPEGTPSDPANNVQFVVTEVAGRLKLNLFYHQHLFSDLGMLERIKSLSEQVLDNPQITLAELQTVHSASERVQLVENWNNTHRDYDLSLCVHQKFEMLVQAMPENIAIIDDNGSYSYSELNIRANKLAHYLIESGVQVSDLVGLCADRSRDFLVGILGIMKAGGAYVPMDPKYPDDRIEYMIQNSEVSVLITEVALLQKSDAVSAGVTRLCLDRDWSDIESRSSTNPNLPITTRSRAYMIYTSGSTGLPKGAIVRHDGAMNHIEAECEVLAFSDAFSFLQTAPSSSDISVWQFVGPVTRGGKVVVLDDVTHSKKLFQLVKDNDIDVVELVPVALQLLMEYVRSLPEINRGLPSLRWMMATGEAVSVELVNDWLALYPDVPVVNAYGPTEAADDVIQCAITAPLPITQKSVPIGKPLGNLKVYIVDELLRLVPAGVPGEICIGGIGVGEGYWKNPEKTAQAFVTDPYTNAVGSIMYRTGDLGRWLADGSVEYLDRVDNQVKVRGFRIELGEVEAALSSLPGVRENVVIVRDDLPGGKALAAYVVPLDQSETLEPQRLRSLLRDALPDFMVPAAIVVMDKLPLTPAGKIDRKSLPRPVTMQLGGSEYVAPRTDAEAQLVQIWESLMPVERIGVTDNFFELGGHSLIGVRIMAKVNKAFGTQLQVAALLTTQTIEKLALLVGDETHSASPIVPIAVGEKPPIFMIHPVGGDVLCYADIARTLSSEFSVYGVRAQGLDGHSDLAPSLAEMISRYVEAITVQQPVGPYRLLGQSLGGILAIAVAARLEAAGHVVSHVVMLDTYSPQHLSAAGATESEIVTKALGVTSVTGLDRADQVASGENHADSTAYLARLYQVARQAGVIPEEMPADQFACIYRVTVQNHTFASQYEVENITANVHHFTAADNVTGEPSGNSWKQVMPTLESTAVPGGHESMMRGEHAESLGQAIISRLKSDNNNNE